MKRKASPGPAKAEAGTGKSRKTVSSFFKQDGKDVEGCSSTSLKGVEISCLGDLLKPSLLSKKSVPEQISYWADALPQIYGLCSLVCQLLSG